MDFYGGIGRGGDGKGVEGCNQTAVISHASLSTNVGAVNLGVHYITSNKGQYQNITPNVKMPALTFSTIVSGVKLSGGYGKNTVANSQNTLYQIKVHKDFGIFDFSAKYWDYGANANPVAVGNTQEAWDADRDLSFNATKGYLFVAGKKLSDAALLEGWYLNYGLNSAPKAGSSEANSSIYGITLTLKF
jgi:hypothetical protein